MFRHHKLELILCRAGIDSIPDIHDINESGDLTEYIVPKGAIRTPSVLLVHILTGKPRGHE